MKKRFTKLLAFILAVVVLVTAVPVHDSYYAADYRPGAQSGPSSSYKSGKYYSNYLQVPITGDNRTDLIAMALSQLGYQEGSANGYFSGTVAGSANYTEFSYNMGDLGLGYGGSDYPWCACFVSWCLYQSHCTDQATYKALARYHSGDYDYIWKEISCSMWVKQLKGAGYYKYSAYQGGSYTPKSGDLVFFQNSSGIAHIGICLYTSGGRIYTVEGNTSDSSGLETNGGGVYFKNYSLSTSYINGYGVLPYVEDSSVPDIDYSGTNPTTGLYVSNAAKTVYTTETGTASSYTMSRFTMFEVTEVCSNGRLKCTYTTSSGTTVTGYILNNTSRVIQLSSNATDNTEAARTNLQSLMNEAMEIRHYNYTEATILKIREAYDNAEALVASSTATEAQLTAAANTLRTLISTTGSNTIAHNNEGVYVNGRDGVIGAGDCFIYSMNFNNGLITVDNANIRYTLNVVFEWDSTRAVNVVKSITQGTGNSTPDIQLEEGQFLIACHDWETGVSASDNPVEYSSTNYKILNSLNVGDAVKLSGATALGTGTTVEPAAFLKFMPADSVFMTGRNEKIESGDFHLFTTEFNSGVLTADNANIDDTLNVLIQWDNDLYAWIVKAKFEGLASDSLTLAEGQALLSGHVWESGVSDPVYGSTANWQALNSAKVGQKVVFSGISPNAGSTSISVAANVSFEDVDSSTESTGNANLAYQKTYDIINPGTTAHNAYLTDGVYVTELNEGGWFGFMNSTASSACNTTNGVGYVTIDLGASYELDKIQMHIYAGENEASVAPPSYVNVLVSSDGTNFIKVGNLAMDADAEESYWAILEDADAIGRYVKFEVGPSGRSSWVFLNEIEIYGNDLSDYENVALSKSYETTSDTTDYSTSLTDGIHTTELVENGWLGLASEDGTSSVIINLENRYKISDVIAHIFAGENSISAASPASIVVSVSADGTNYIKLGELKVDDSATECYWAPLEQDTIVGQYVKLEITAADTTALTLLNEVEVYGTLYSQTDENNIALGKTYIAPAYSNSPFNADLTDGIASSTFQYGVNNSSWFAFQNTGDSSTGNVSNNRGIITLDLGGNAEITDISIHLFAGTNDANAVQPDYINVYLSSDGETFTYIKTIAPDSSKTEAYWATYNTGDSPVYARYIKFAFGTSEGDLVLLNEIKINGVMLTSNEAAEPGTISSVTLAGDFNDWNSTPNMYTVDDTTVSASLTLDAGSYEFKILYGNEWYGNNGTIIDTTLTSSDTGWTMETSADNCTLTASYSGEYKFTFDTETKTLVVAYIPDTLYLRGSFNDWGTDIEMIDNGNGIYSTTISLDAGFYDFKVADENYGYQCPEFNQVLDLSKASEVTFTLNLYEKVITTTIVVTEFTVTFVDYDGTVLSVQTVEVGEAATAPAEPTRTNYRFTGWDKDFSIVTENLTVTAQYELYLGKLRIDVNSGDGFSISVDNGTAKQQGNYYVNSKMPIGSYITVTAKNTSGNKFLGWIDPANGKILSSELTYSFYTGGNDYIKALFQAEVEGTNFVIFQNDKSGQYFDMQYYTAGDEVVFPDAPTQVGYDFAGWDHTEEEIQAKLAAGEDVVVTATWTVAQVYVDITVTGGTIVSHGGQNDAGQYLAAKAVTVEADAAAEGMKFAYWKDGNGNVRGYDTTYKFYPGTDTELTAVYVEEDVTVEREVLVYLDSCDTSGAYGTFLFSWYVPEKENGLTYQGAGIVAVNKANYKESTLYHGTTDSNVWDRSATGSSNTASNTYAWVGPVYAGNTWVAMAWVQYTDTDGNTVVEYSELFEITKY